MKNALAIARLTVREGVRMRIVLVMVVLLVLIVTQLPFALKGDETVSGRLQTFLAYSLGAMGFLLGISTVFLACATLSTEFRTKTLHLIVTKPVARIEILLGKWLGITFLNLALLTAGALAVYSLAVFVKNRPAQFERDRVKLEDTIWTARVAGTPIVPDFAEQARRYIDEQVQQGRTFSQGAELARVQAEHDLQERWRQVAPGERRLFEFTDLPAPDESSRVYQVRFKARGTPIPPEELLPITWAVVDPETGGVEMMLDSRERHGQVHQFFIPIQVVKDGRAALGVINPTENITIYFEGTDGLQLLYRVGSFEGNYLGCVLLILMRLAFLAALGLFFSTFVSFPTASVTVLLLYVLCSFKPDWLDVIGAKMEVYDPQLDPYGTAGPYIRALLAPLLELLLPDFTRYNGTSLLVDGFAIRAESVASAALRTLTYGLALLALPGWLIFYNREVAEVTV